MHSPGVAPGANRPLLLAWSWLAFALVHGVLIWLALTAPGWPLGDVEVVYRGWAEDAASGANVVGVTSAFVYPILATVPIFSALALGPNLYVISWLGIVTLQNAGAYLVLVRAAGDRRRLVAAWWWLGFLLLLGPVALGRIDAITVPLVIVGLLWASTRPIWAGTLLVVATWVKVWPAAIIAALLVTGRNRGRMFALAAGVSAAIVAVALILGSGGNVFSFVGEQTSRGLQIEAPVSGLWLWQVVAQVPGASIYYDFEILTYQVTGRGVGLASALMTPLLALLGTAVLVLGVLAQRRGLSWSRLFPALALALVLTLIVANKVGSPQFMTWLAAPIILGLVVRGSGWRIPAVIALVMAGLTQLIYPVLYDQLLAADVLAVSLLTGRNLLEFVLLGWALWQVWPYAGPKPDVP